MLWVWCVNPLKDRWAPVAMNELRRERLAVCHELEGRIADYRVAIKKEERFNRQVELHRKMKELEKQLQKLAAGL